MIPRMSRFPCARLFALAFTGALITSCGGNPPPRPPKAIPAAGGGQPVHVAAIPKNAPPPVAAESAIVIDVVSGRVLYAKNADAPRAVASTQKIVTALCVLDAGNIDKPVTIQPIDGACEPTNLNLKPGDV
jgi:D-alanyl-D-alanine carboxypeptidase (penicillin-binding protein 5/6)